MHYVMKSHTVSSYVFIYLHPKLASTYSSLLPHYIKWLHLCNKIQSVGCRVIFIRLHADSAAAPRRLGNISSDVFVCPSSLWRNSFGSVDFWPSAGNRYTRPSVEWSTTLFAQWLRLRNNALSSSSARQQVLYALLVCITIAWINVIALPRDSSRL